MLMTPRGSRSIVDIDTDCHTLQVDLASIYRWAADVNMTFNSEKFECLRFWPKIPKPDCPYVASDGSNIEEKHNLRDLGVQISTDLNFKNPISNTVIAANKLAGWAPRSFGSRLVMMTIWKNLIQSKHDYCSQLRSESDQSFIRDLESVSRHYTSL